MYEDLKEYLNWYDTRSDVKFAKDAPVIGLVLQRSHLVTGDEAHYSGVVMEMEARGAKVIRPPPPPLSLSPPGTCWRPACDTAAGSEASFLKKVLGRREVKDSAQP